MTGWQQLCRQARVTSCKQRCAYVETYGKTVVELRLLMVCQVCMQARVRWLKVLRAAQQPAGGSWDFNFDANGERLDFAAAL